MADAPEEEDEARTTFASLPLALAQHCIFARLSLDERLRCAEVCRAWCAALRERSLWRSINLSSAWHGIMKCRTREEAEAGGIAHNHARTRRRFEELLRAAAARASGELQVLDVSFAAHAVVLDVVTANAGALRELSWQECSGGGRLLLYGAAQIEALLRAAPRLRSLNLCQVSLDANFAPGALDAVVDAAIAWSRSWALGSMTAGRASFTTRACRSWLWRCAPPRRCACCTCRRWGCGAADVLLPALVGHPSLTTLTLRDDALDAHAAAAQEAAGALFADILAADAPALTSLDVSFCNLGAPGLRRIAAALGANTHLRALRVAGNIGGGRVPFAEARWRGDVCDGHNGNAFRTERDIMLPAVRAHTALRTLDSLASWPCEAEESFLRARADADAEADDVQAPALSSSARALVARRRHAYTRGGVSLEQLGYWYHA
jgi:hypothetical protein